MPRALGEADAGAEAWCFIVLVFVMLLCFMLYALYIYAFCNALLLCSSGAACPVLSVKPMLRLMLDALSS